MSLFSLSMWRVDQRGSGGYPGMNSVKQAGGKAPAAKPGSNTLAGYPGHGVATRDYPGYPGYPGTSPTPTPTPAPGGTLQVAAGSQLACAVEKATDWDYWTMGGQSGYEADTVNYKWAYSGPDTTTGSFIDPADPTQDATTTLTPTWVAPTTPGTYTLTCTIDDAPAQVDASESGSRDDAPVVRSVTVQVVAAPVVTFTGEKVSNGTVRACAGGWDDHDAKNAQGNVDSQYRAHTRMLTAQVMYQGQPASNLPIEFEFAGNVGHDYGTDNNGNTIPKKFAMVHDPATSFLDATNWKTSDTRTEDANGNIGLWVKSSDVISQPVLQAFWTDQSGHKISVGSVRCDFGATTYVRRFINPHDPDEKFPDDDTGWIFDFPQLTGPNKTTPAKVYVKFKRDLDKGDDYVWTDASGSTHGNWNFVNNHQLTIRLGSVELAAGTHAEVSGKPEDLQQYAIVIGATDGPANPQEMTATRTATGKGETAPQPYVKAGSNIDQVQTLWLEADDLTQWDY